MENQELVQLAKQIDDGHKIKETLETTGWQDIIEPMLDAMITDVLGGKVEGRWSDGLLHAHVVEAEAINLVWYKKALVDLHNRIYQYVDALPQLTKEYTRSQSLEESPEFTRPMEESSY